MDKIFKSNDNKLQIRSMRSILPVKLAVFLKITHNIGGDAQKWAFFFFYTAAGVGIHQYGCFVLGRDVQLFCNMYQDLTCLLHKFQLQNIQKQSS